MSQTVLGTGATSGIGESLCLLFASDGYDLVTVARDEEALEKQADELPIPPPRKIWIYCVPTVITLSSREQEN